MAKAAQEKRKTGNSAVPIRVVSDDHLTVHIFDCLTWQQNRLFIHAP